MCENLNTSLPSMYEWSYEIVAPFVRNTYLTPNLSHKAKYENTHALSTDDQKNPDMHDDSR